LGGVDKSNIITSGRTRGKRINYTEDPGIGGLDVNNGAEGEGRKETNGAARPRTKSPQRKPVKAVEEVEENEGEEDESEGGGDEDDDDDDDDNDDDDEETMGSEEEEEE